MPININWGMHSFYDKLIWFDLTLLSLSRSWLGTFWESIISFLSSTTNILSDWAVTMSVKIPSASAVDKLAWYANALASFNETPFWYNVYTVIKSMHPSTAIPSSLNVFMPKKCTLFRYLYCLHLQQHAELSFHICLIMPKEVRHGHTYKDILYLQITMTLNQDFPLIIYDVIVTVLKQSIPSGWQALPTRLGHRIYIMSFLIHF